MHSDPHSIKRLNATLPEALARFVGQMTGEGGLYETPSEYVRDLIRRHMEKIAATEQVTINAMLRQSLTENKYSDYAAGEAATVRKAILE